MDEEDGDDRETDVSKCNIDISTSSLSGMAMTAFLDDDNGVVFCLLMDQPKSPLARIQSSNAILSKLCFLSGVQIKSLSTNSENELKELNSAFSPKDVFVLEQSERLEKCSVK